MLLESCRAADVRIWAYCLMPNHVHLVLVPRTKAGLSAALSVTHRQYTRHINFREGWRGFLWQGRFASFPMDEEYLLACARYVELNPVRAKLARRARDWKWSSARAHLGLADDPLVDVNGIGEMVSDWKGFLAGGLHEKERDAIRAGERTGRPLGSPDFIAKLERRLKRPLARQKPGPKPKKKKPQKKSLKK